MKIRKFSISRSYEIKCKLFEPKDSPVKQIIIGVHGFAGDKESSMLRKLGKECTRHCCGLLCFDFPAHGNSPVNEDMLTVENCKQDLYGVLQYARKQYPNAVKSIFATSFGGYITLLSAHSFPDYPLVLRAPAVTMPKLLLKNVLCTTEEHFKQVGSIRCGFERPIQLPYRFLEELQQQEDLSKKKLPQEMLIIHGDRDNIVPLEDIRAFTEHHQGASLQILPGADHRFKNPGETERILFLTRSFLHFEPESTPFP